jgi:hypothetical protein
MAVPSLTTATVTTTFGFTQSGGNLQSSASFSSPVARRMGAFDSPATIQEEHDEGTRKIFGNKHCAATF